MVLLKEEEEEEEEVAFEYGMPSAKHSYPGAGKVPRGMPPEERARVPRGRTWSLSCALVPLGDGIVPAHIFLRSIEVCLDKVGITEILLEIFAPTYATRIWGA
jgi:hypothetical protein